jgi:hypothetical protein
MPTIPIKDMIYGGILIAVILGGLWYHHKLITEGIAEQKAADDKASATLIEQATKQTADLQTRATMAEQAYDKEVANNAANSQPTQPVRLCLYSHVGGSSVPEASATKSGNASPGPAATNVQQLPSGNSSSGGGASGPDISGLLQLFANRADQVSAVLREYQTR